MEVSSMDWTGYARTMNGLTWRVATVDDLPAILELWSIKERYLGCKQDIPPLFARPTLLTLVAEDGRGRIADGLYVEITADVTKFGCTRRGFESTFAVTEDIADWLKQRGFRRATIVAPKKWSEKMADFLRKIGFVGLGDRSVYWSRRL